MKKLLSLAVFTILGIVIAICFWSAAKSTSVAVQNSHVTYAEAMYRRPDLRAKLLGMSEIEATDLLGYASTRYYKDGTTSTSYVVERDKHRKPSKYLHLTLAEGKVTSAEIIPGKTFSGIENPKSGEDL